MSTAVPVTCFRLAEDPHTGRIHCVVFPLDPKRISGAALETPALCGATGRCAKGCHPMAWTWVKETRHLHALCGDCARALATAQTAAVPCTA